MKGLAESPRESTPPDREGQRVLCTECGHVWVGFYLPLPILRAVRVMRNLTCPNCGATSTHIRFKE